MSDTEERIELPGMEGCEDFRKMAYAFECGVFLGGLLKSKGDKCKAFPFDEVWTVLRSMDKFDEDVLEYKDLVARQMAILEELEYAFTDRDIDFSRDNVATEIGDRFKEDLHEIGNCLIKWRQDTRLPVDEEKIKKAIRQREG